MPKTRILIAITILILATLACNALSTSPTSAPTQITQPQGNLPRTEDDVPRVQVEVAYTAYTAGAAIIVDVRSAAAYDESHIPNALSIPLDEFEINIEGVNLDREQWIITYCT